MMEVSLLQMVKSKGPETMKVDQSKMVKAS
jgi:hypothetical protein